MEDNIGAKLCSNCETCGACKVSFDDVSEGGEKQKNTAFTSFLEADSFAEKLTDRLQETPYKNAVVMAWVQLAENGREYDVDLVVYSDELPQGKTPEIAKCEVFKILKDDLGDYEPTFVKAHPSGHVSPKIAPVYSRMVIS